MSEAQEGLETGAAPQLSEKAGVRSGGGYFRNFWLYTPGGVGYFRNFWLYTRKLLPGVQPFTLFYTILTEKGPLSYTFY